MAKYKVLSDHWHNDCRKYLAGEELETEDGFVPCQTWQPIDATAKAAWKKAGYPESLTAEDLLVALDATGAPPTI